jgi:hypothetical protein
MPIDVLAGFVDRRDELTLFHQMLRGEVDKRVLLVLDAAEKGKTCFLRRVAHECRKFEPAAQVLLLDFDQRRSGLTDCASIGREVRRVLGDERAPALCACEGRPPADASGTAYRGALLQVLVEQFSEVELDNLCFVLGEEHENLSAKGLAGKARELIRLFERLGRVDELLAEIERQRPSLRRSELSQAASAPPSRSTTASEPEMGRALFSDLAGLAETHSHLVVLIDTFEHASPETCAWLERWLFEPLERELAHVWVVVAGRPECEKLFSSSPQWGHLARTLQRLNPLSDDDILMHYKLREISVSQEETSLVLRMARLSPAKMAQVGDLLQQAQGGQR